MEADCITYQETRFFSKIIVDYLNQEEKLSNLYHHFPNIENFEKQLTEKDANFHAIFNSKRVILVSSLQKQYSNIQISEATKQNIFNLNDSKTFTVTTGHQLNLFTGPIYFLYKIISTINLCKELSIKYPSNNFVPIYWMATEDHDFEEINHFYFNDKKLQWKINSKGPVGRLTTRDLKDFLEIFKSQLGNSLNANNLVKLFEESYLRNDNLAAATRDLANQLFGEYGLVIIDGDDGDLKKIFAPYIKDELLHQNSFAAVSKTINQLSEYSIQVNPREINLFYIENNLRERIILENGIYKINNTEIEFTVSDILNLLETNPEKFSPNVIMRPLYQEVVLPNLAYIGGGGEIAYWLELKSMFDYHNITFPILILRNSVLLVTDKLKNKLQKLGLTWKDIFLNQQDLINQKTAELSEIEIDFSAQKEFLSQQFETLEKLALQTDKSFIGAVNAQKAKQIKGLNHLEKRLLTAQKKKYVSELERISSIQNELFPSGSLQERKTNFSQFYINYGDDLIPKLIENLNPLEQEFKIIIL